MNYQEISSTDLPVKQGNLCVKHKDATIFTSNTKFKMLGH